MDVQLASYSKTRHWQWLKKTIFMSDAEMLSLGYITNPKLIQSKPVCHTTLVTLASVIQPRDGVSVDEPKDQVQYLVCADLSDVVHVHLITPRSTNSVQMQQTNRAWELRNSPSKQSRYWEQKTSIWCMLCLFLTLIIKGTVHPKMKIL